MKKIFWLVLAFHSGASAISFWTGHREAMLANGGFTNTCSPAQFIQNPAGVFCPDSNSKTESFGSSGVSSFQNNIQNKNMRDMQGTKARLGPGLSLFSQTFHETSFAWGFSASIHQLEMQKYLELSHNQGPGTADFVLRQNDASLGLYFSSRVENIYWGASLNLMQREMRNTYLSKYKIEDAYYLQTINSSSLEHSLGLRLGAILDLTDFRYAIIFKPRSYSIQGTSRSEPTLAGGNNVFTEEVKDGTIKTSDPWHLSLAFEYKLISEDKFFVDIGWKSPEHKDVEFEERHSTAAMLTTSLGYEKKWTERILLLGGGRWMRTFSESAADSKNQTFLVTSGIIRKFKTVELGTTLGYFIQNNEAYDKNTGSFSPASRFTGFDIAFSSAFSY